MIHGESKKDNTPRPSSGDVSRGEEGGVAGGEEGGVVACILPNLVCRSLMIFFCGVEEEERLKILSHACI